MKRTLLSMAALLVLIAVPAAAQTAYKSTMPNGKVIYGDKPIPGARKVEEISVSSPRIGSTGVGAAISRQEGDERRQAKTPSQQQRAAGQAQDQKGQKIREAEEALRMAEEAKRDGEEPLPGERSGVSGGGSRLSEEYFQRQKKLEEDVVHARHALDLARSGGQ